MKITLCGIKHAGKTSAGKALAKMLDLPFADTDDILQDLYNTRHNTALSVREIFRALGSDLFRQLEAEAIRTLAGKQGVFALGAFFIYRFRGCIKPHNHLYSVALCCRRYKQ